MGKIERDFLEYVSTVAGERATWGSRAPAHLPRYLTQMYTLVEIAIGRLRFLGVLLKSDSELRPAAIEKHIRQIMSTAADLDGYCLIAGDLPGYVRQRLVERKVPFVVPHRQLFWPELGLAVQARRKKSAPRAVTVVSPATQAVLIGALTGVLPARSTPKSLAQTLGYTSMTMSRAVDEIEANALGQVQRDGRERVLKFPEDRRALWQRALPYLQTPVRKMVRVKGGGLPGPKGFRAGETALAAWSMLVPPAEPTYALGSKGWKAVGAKAEEVPVQDAGTCRVQLWRYDPAPFAREGQVDRFSLYLSLRDDADERVEAALEEMMEGAPWS